MYASQSLDRLCKLTGMRPRTRHFFLTRFVTCANTCLIKTCHNCLNICYFHLFSYFDLFWIFWSLHFFPSRNRLWLQTVLLAARRNMILPNWTWYIGMSWTDARGCGPAWGHLLGITMVQHLTWLEQWSIHAVGLPWADNVGLPHP